MLAYDEITKLVNQLLLKLNDSKQKVNIFLKSGKQDQAQAIKYHEEMSQVKNMLEDLVESLVYNKYVDTEINFVPDATYLKYDDDDNVNINRALDPLIKSYDVDKIKNYILNINSEDGEKWVIFTIIYQKLNNIIKDQIRILLKHFLLVKMLGLYDYKKDFDNKTFEESAEETMNEMGEPYIDEIIVKVLTDDSIKKPLESLRRTDVEITKLFRNYKNVGGIDELFKNLLQTQFNTFIIKIKPYCQGSAFGTFIDKFVGVFNKKLGSM
jgi:hypothetical protein